jgi:uncharacterized FlaG/YvyC family protein
MLFMKFLLFFICITLCLSQSKSIQTFTKSMQKKEGFFNYYIDEGNNKAYLEIEKYEKEFLYLNSLPSGLGSNDIGLDRGQMGNTHLVKFMKYGNRVLLMQVNTGFRANSENEMERLAVEEAFAQSVIFSANIVAKSKQADLIELSDFIFRDSHDVVTKLKNQNQGNFSLMKNASVLYKKNCKNFPENTEFEVQLTYNGEAKGSYLRSVTINNKFFTLRTHHSFVQLPDDKYQKRAFDPRSGSFGIRYFDYANSIEEPLLERYIARHRLAKKNPEQNVSEVIEPIVYYLDSGCPEPVRSALLEGGSWWAEAFEAAGFKNAFQIKMLPKNADPMDVRYNVIQWVHRSTRGWSYGSTIMDPRTGEIIKGHVTLGSLRVRQDFMIAEALLSPYNGSKVSEEMKKMALARLRQLSAHEIGHTLGFAHNFATSTKGRISVMDYPHPYIQLKNDKLDFSKAYDTGIGEWDKIAVSYAYSQFVGNEEEALNKIIKNYQSKGIAFISDADARAKSGLHPSAHLWDNGADIIEELSQTLAVRRHALENFGKNTIANHESYADLESKLVPIYLYHRYQAEAVVKLIAGMEYHYAKKDETSYENKLVDSQKQRKALAALLSILDPINISIPDKILKIIPPKAYGSYRDSEQFKLRTAFNLDPLSLVEANASFLFELLLNPQRLNRIESFRIQDQSMPSLNWILEEVNRKLEASNNTAIKVVLHRSFINHIYKAIKSSSTNIIIRSILHHHLEELAKQLNDKIDDTDDFYLKSYYQFLRMDINQFRSEPIEYNVEENLDLPPGSPIGMECYY